MPGRIFSVAPFAGRSNSPTVCPQRASGLSFRKRARSVRAGDGRRDSGVVGGHRVGWPGDSALRLGSIRRKSFAGQHIALERFAEMARFNMGSTVILLMPEGMATLDALQPQQPVLVGQRIGVC